MPSKAGNDTVAIALVLDLEHHALVRFVNAGSRLGDDTIETRAFKAAKPIGRNTRFPCCRRQMERRRRGCKDGLQHLAPLFEGHASQISLALAEDVEKHDRCGRFQRKQFYPRRSGMKTELEQVEIERAILCDHDFAVEHATGRQL